MELGAHLPLIDLGHGTPSLAGLVAYARAADALGYTFLCANDHLVSGRPWLDGPTALAATLEASGAMTLATTVSLAVVRGPLQLAKALAALDRLSGGRVVAGVGPGSSARDYAAVGIPFEERWQRLDEAIAALRALWNPAVPPFVGRFYSTEGVTVDPPPAREAGPPIWVGSWGSPAGLRRVARLGDGWLASAYNATPSRFRKSLDALGGTFTNGLATMWLYITESRRSRNAILADVLAPMLNRSVEELDAVELPLGGLSTLAEVLGAYEAAGAQRVFLWPLADEIRQLELAASL